MCDIVKDNLRSINRLPGARRSITCDPRSYYDRKVVVLQFLQNSARITRKERYAQIVNGLWTNRTTTWATQTQIVTNPNTRNLLRDQYILQEIKTKYPIECKQPFIHIDYNVLPPPINKIDSYDTLILPPRPESGSSTNVIPIVPGPIVDISVYRSGGVLICREKDNWCPKT